MPRRRETASGLRLNFLSATLQRTYFRAFGCLWAFRNSLNTLPVQMTSDGHFSTDVISTSSSSTALAKSVDKVIVTITWILMLLTFPFSLLFCLKIVHEYRRMVVFRLGRIRGRRPLGPGIVFVLPFIDDHETVDLRTMSYDVPTQEMLTRDSVTVSVDAAVYYRTRDPIAALSAVTDAHLSTRQLAQTTLRNVLGTRTLGQIMIDREGIAAQAKMILDQVTATWGIHVERVEIKDIRLPRELCRAMAAEAEAVRESDARVVCAQGELNASVALRKAADELSGCPTALQLRYLHSLTKISAHDNHTVVVPVPFEALRKLIQRFQKKKY